jgi:hypothetical protein
MSIAQQSEVSVYKSTYDDQDVQEVKPMKLNFIDRWFNKKAKKAVDRVMSDSRRGPIGPSGPKGPPSMNSFNISAEGLNVTIYGATGGQIVEFRKYNNKIDRNESKVYVIPTEQNFVESFSKIVSMEMIR